MISIVLLIDLFSHPGLPERESEHLLKLQLEEEGKTNFSLRGDKEMPCQMDVAPGCCTWTDGMGLDCWVVRAPSGKTIGYYRSSG